MKKLDISNIIEIASIVFICFVVAYLVRDDILKTNKIEYLEKEIEYYKQKTSNQELIDSLTFNIVKQDSIISETKKSYIYEIELVEANNNIDAVAQFKELIGAE